MGLDMYLTANKYLSQHDEEGSKTSEKINEILGLEKTDFNVKSVRVEAMYWRKANAIHSWFVRNVQGGDDNCQEHDVSREDLIKLLAVCNHVIQFKEKAEKLLPIMEGFFFGGNEYDDWYFDDVAKTIDGINQIIKTFDDTYWFSYQSSW
jgi:hypothetical protein